MSAVPSQAEAAPLRAMTAADAPAAAALSRAVGWLHREEDWRFAIGLGDGIVIEQDGEIVATALSWPFGARHATLGMIIVAPDRQGAGLGKRLMAALLARTQGRSQLLNATQEGRPLYEKVGFRVCGEVYQHQGVAGEPGRWRPAEGEALRSAGRADLPALAALDAAATGLDRAGLLAALLDVGEAVLLERGGTPVAFGVLRGFGRGEVIGPLIAPDDAAARTVAGHWIAARKGSFLRIDLDGERAIAPWLEAAGLVRVAGVVSMVRGELPVPSGPAQRYALVNQALS